MLFFAALFFCTACLYAAAGLGGGSTYIAILLLADIHYALIPIVALACNIVVVAGSSLNFMFKKLINLRLLIPHLTGSVPAAFIGGMLPVDKYVFEIIVCLALTLAGLQLLWSAKGYKENVSAYHLPSLPLAIGIGAGLGFVSGLIGIGGGIFLAPVLYLIRAARPVEIASTASVFILINSVAGLAGQFQKIDLAMMPPEFCLLPLAVLIGGQIGHHVSLHFLSASKMARLTSLLILFVAARIGYQLLSGGA